jgi:trans-aconitate 2-methyltransferase
MPWNPELYGQFETQRAAAFADLLALIDVRTGLRVVDLGCGDGALTARLADHLPGSDVLGLDSSPEMLARARDHVRPGLRFEPGDLSALAGEWDLVFSYAALQWVPDHRALVPCLLACVRSGGQIAVQMATDHDHPARVLLRETACEVPFYNALGGWTRPILAQSIDTYAGLLFAGGMQAITVFEKIYPVALPDVDAVIDWYRGTALIPYLDRLPDALHAPFLDHYRARLLALWPTGPILYTGKRIVFAALKGG